MLLRWFRLCSSSANRLPGLTAQVGGLFVNQSFIYMVFKIVKKSRKSAGWGGFWCFGIVCGSFVKMADFRGVLGE